MSLYYSIKRVYRQIVMFLYWGWTLRNDVDYDCDIVWKFLSKKYRRVYKHMLKNSHLEWNSSADKPRMKKLLTLTTLCERLSDGDVYYSDVECPRASFEDMGNGFLRYHTHWKSEAHKMKWLADNKIRMNLRKEESQKAANMIGKYNDGFWD